MTAYELLEKHYPNLLIKIKRKFPEFLETSKLVQVIEWEKDFEIYDHNSNIIDKIIMLDKKLENKEISEEEYYEQIKSFKDYARKVMGISFIETKEVAFREKVPSEYVLIHEIGHIHYEVNDKLWSSTYGGGETLFWLSLKDKYKINDKAIRKFHSYLKEALEGDYLAVSQEIIDKISKKLGKDIGFYNICIMTGWLPEGLILQAPNVDIFDFNSPELKETLPLRQDVILFFANLISGLIYNDIFWQEYAKSLEIIE